MSRETQGDGAEPRLTRGYVQLCVAPPDVDGAKTVSLARFGHYDVRLVEFVPANPADSCRAMTSRRPRRLPRGLFRKPKCLTRHRAE